jgi:enoyl reductase-like protein
VLILTEKAVEIIEGLKAAGIKHVAFKSGSVDGIRQVISIAAANPEFLIIMRWTCGTSLLQNLSSLDDPLPFVETFFAKLSLGGGAAACSRE